MKNVSEEEKQRIIDLYQSGLPVSQITEMVFRGDYFIKDVLKEAGVFCEKRGTKKGQITKRPVFAHHDNERENTAIRRSEILKLRQDTQIGDVFIIRTEKGERMNAEISEKARNKEGTLKRVTVTNTDNPRFCIVKLVTGITEMVLWSDIARCKRNNSEYIEG